MRAVDELIAAEGLPDNVEVTPGYPPIQGLDPLFEGKVAQVGNWVVAVDHQALDDLAYEEAYYFISSMWDNPQELYTNFNEEFASSFNNPEEMALAWVEETPLGETMPGTTRALELPSGAVYIPTGD
jgi:hypothetical protein